MTLLTFIIPVRHQDNARDWGKLTARLSETVRSISNQRHDDWRAIIVVNEGAVLPELPPKFSVTRVTFPRNDLHDLEKGPREAVLDAFRLDKGRRVLKGMLDARDSRFFMIVDDDDLVSAQIVSHAARHPDANGWIITQGYLWDDGGSFFLEVDRFNHRCGTSLIIRSDLYDLPPRFEDAEIEWIKDMLGSHHRIDPALARQGTPLASLPFRGAVYRVANAGSHSQTRGLVKQALLNPNNLKRPHRAIRNLFRFRLIGDRFRREFFG